MRKILADFERFLLTNSKAARKHAIAVDSIWPKASILRRHSNTLVPGNTQHLTLYNINYNSRESAMEPHARLLSAVTLSAPMFFGAAAMAADLPQSGTIKSHSAAKGTVQTVQVGEKHLMGVGSNWHVTYNESGSGPLHMGAAMCTFAFNDVNGAATYVGDCAFGDAGGADKIFVAYSGNGDGATAQGGGPITGGTGKYAGIGGKLAWQCKYVEASQALIACTQQFDYQLKK